MSAHPLKHIPATAWAGGLTLAAVALLYLLTLDTGLRPDELIGGDLITHQYAQVQARPSNAPGYPLYTMGGWLWFHLGGWGWRWLLNPTQGLSAYSLLWGVAALVILYLLLLRLVRWPLAALLTAFQATTFFFWYYSVTTEQYTSAVFQTLLLVWLAWRWDDRPSDGRLLALAFVSGTMLANMVTTLFILPPLLGFIFFKRGPAGLYLGQYLRRPGLTLKAVGAGLLPLVSYAYIYIRGAQHPQWRGQGEWPSAWAWFVDFITIQQGRDELAPGLTARTFFTGEFPALMWQELTLLIFAGGLLGLLFLGRRRAIFLLTTLAIYLVFCWAYRFGNWFQVIIPAYPLFVIGFGALLAKISDLAKTQINERVKGNHRPKNSGNALHWVDALMIAVLSGLVLFNLNRNWVAANQRYQPEDTGLDPGWAILADEPRRPAQIVAGFEERLALEYLGEVWSVAAGIEPVETPPSTLSQLPVLYVTRQAAAADPALIPATAHPQAAGQQLIALWPQPRQTLPSQAQPLTLSFGPTLQLTGWELPEPTLSERWQLALYWQAQAPLPHDYTISLRPLMAGQLLPDATGVLMQDHQPVWNSYPTSRWQPGELVRDLYALPLPPGVAVDGVQVVVYRKTTAGFENLADHSFALEPGQP